MKNADAAFLNWFGEQEGFHLREERFWDACERGSKDELFQWLKTSWELGFRAGAQTQGKLSTEPK